MTAHAHQPIEPARQPPYLAGDRVQILYMSERGTILADAYVTAVFRRPDGSFGVNAVMSDARASFHLFPATGDATTIAHQPPVRVGVDHAEASG
ncbi:hypothetical protein SAMN05892883_2190 [Jatrophihabitans sp. GAS493]|uniref:hypothetical protein n=1 Tax=Jatrophihabitans sp. GAS493 TaxID=1907575 RepID=UPI000BC02771|nr:hypothetical protein [Jatrophihabitans sp. GAS493]SOD72867.1 hypothetical protein SAMN05892883_2190 [Jatrophihabitans sp. GAS493]